MSPPDGLPMLPFESAEAWEAWLRDRHDSTPGLWLQIAKKGSGISSVSYGEAVDIALCYGWIDGQKGRLDERFYLQRFTPRRPKSMWSKMNTRKVEELIAGGRMQPAGLREVEAAKADGRWNAAYQSFRELTLPDDLAAALSERSGAKAAFDELDKTSRYAIVFRVENAKRPETRRARIEAFVAMLERGECLQGRAPGSAGRDP